MANDLKNLSTLFNNRVFRVPDYQRGYAWQNLQLEDFWEDLTGLSGVGHHYTGQLTLEKVPVDTWKNWQEDNWLVDGKGFTPYFVVDGQQRLTTAIILIKCLLERIADDGMLAFTGKTELKMRYLVQTAQLSRSYIFGYEKDNPSYEFFKTKILDEPSSQYQGIRTTYTANLEGAQAFFRERLAKANSDTIDLWFRALTQRFVFNVYEVESDLDVFVVFETMNNRGKSLSRLELMKNRLIYLSTLFPAPDILESDRQTLRRDINEAWKTAYQYLGMETNRPLDDDDFLRAHWIMSFQYSRDEAGQYAHFLMTEHFTVKRLVQKSLKAPEIQGYVASIQSSVRKWHAIHFPAKSQEITPSTARGLERLARLGRAAFAPLIMAVLQRTSVDGEIEALLAAAERYVFTVSRVTQRRADTGDSDLYSLASEIRGGQVSVPVATGRISALTTKYYLAPKAISDMNDLFLRAQGFYSWSGLRYLLYEYEESLRSAGGMSSAKLTWDELNSSKSDHVTIEHIYPQTADPHEWPSFDAYTAYQRALLRDSLGNLVALSKSRNSRFSNRPFDRKKKDDQGAQGYFNGSYSEIEVAQYADWTPDTIAERGLRIVDFMEKRWAISMGTREHKLKFLGLEFLATPVTLAAIP